MINSRMTCRVRGRWLAAAMACLVSGLLLTLPGLAQDAAPPPRVEKPGMFESIGRWFDQGAANFRAHLRGAKQKIDDIGDEAAANSKSLGDKAAEAGKSAAEVGKGAAQATKGAVEAVAKLPTARIVNGRERCVVAPNGAPDCVVAAEALCRKNGFTSGKSMDFTSVEECPARALLAGPRAGAECTTVTIVSRAMCQ